MQIGLGSDDPRSRPGFRAHNDHGVVLRGETRSRREDLYPSPLGAADDLETPVPSGASRAIHIDVDADGLLWIVERPAVTR